jgi:mono/diheme cytochrome c family protein
MYTLVVHGRYDTGLALGNPLTVISQRERMARMKVAIYVLRIVVTTLLSGLATLPAPAFAAADIQRGKALYEKNCQGCHGRTGQGVGGATPNLADPTRMSALTDQDLFEAVTKGRPGTGMPSWSAILSEQDRWSVVGYLRTFSRR